MQSVARTKQQHLINIGRHQNALALGEMPRLDEVSWADEQAFIAQYIKNFVDFSIQAQVQDAVLRAKYKVHLAWPYWSGNHLYPIPDVSGCNLPKVAHKYAQGNDSMWTGQYGKLRKEYCKLLGKELMQEPYNE